MDSFDLIADIEISDIIPIIVLGVVQEAASRVPRNTGLSGGDCLRELLSCGTDIRETLKSFRSWFSHAFWKHSDGGGSGISVFYVLSAIR